MTLSALRHLLPVPFSLALVSCQSPSTFSRMEPLEMPADYSGKMVPELDIKDSLLELFDDDDLEQIVERALNNNPELQRSRARMEELGFNLVQSKASYFPGITANGNGTRQKRTEMGTANLFSATLDTRWEVDVWGRIRSGVSAAEADRAAASATYEAARQSLVAQSMQAWFQRIAAERSLELDLQRVASFTTTEKRVQRRFELGQASLAEVDLARTDLENAAADIESSTDRRDQAARQLRVLTGDYPDAGLPAGSWPALERGVPAGLPSDLLRRRPDLIAAYENVVAADARTHVAHADLFPSLTLTGSLGRESESLSDLLKSGFDIWSLAGNLSAPVFEAGQRRAEVRAAGKRAEQAFRNYQTTLITALREVEDALGSETYLAREEATRLRALAAARSAADRASRDYDAGVSSLLSLLETQRRVFTTEQQIINIKAARLNNR
ncbi:MAG: efflux transporter outer membrane subunit, partial [Verrucomicrobiota bacterium]